MSKFVPLLLVICCLFTPLWATSTAPNMTIYEVINKAGYQRMLSQRIAKCYLNVVVGIEAEKHKKHLKGSAKTFESNLRALKGYQTTEEIYNQFRYVEVLWRKYKFIYDDYYTKEKAEEILTYNNKILAACHKAVEMLEAYAIDNKLYGEQELRASDQELAHIINISGKQRMLTQRLALYTLAITYQIGDVENHKQHYSTAISDFSAAYNVLMAYANNTPQIDEEYARIGEQWSQLERDLGTIVAATELDEALLAQVSAALQTADAILFSFDEIVFLYERQKED